MGGEKKINLQMLVIRLTIMKPLTTICFSAYSVPVEHCDSWINHFHPRLGLHGLTSSVCARAVTPPHSQKAYSQNLTLSS